MENRVTRILIVFSALILVNGIVLALFYKGDITGFSVVEGDVSEIAASGVTELSILINNAPIDAELNYSGILPVVIADAGVPLIEFEFNFDNDVLDFSEILIDKEYGALAVAGIPGPKTLYVEQAGMDAVCVRDVETSTVSAMTNDCSSPLEFLMLCNGSTIGEYYCVPDGEKFVVGGLIHTAVKSMNFSSLN